MYFFTTQSTVLTLNHTVYIKHKRPNADTINAKSESSHIKQKSQPQIQYKGAYALIR